MNTFHTWAVADEADAGCRIEVASDASLDEGAVIRTITEPSILSSGVEYFLGLQADEAETIAEALEVLADTDVDARTPDEREAVSDLLARVERLRGYLRGPVDHSDARVPLSRDEALSALSRGGASAARTIPIHLNVRVPASDGRSTDEIVTAVEAALGLGLESLDGVNDDYALRNLVIDVAREEVVN